MKKWLDKALAALKNPALRPFEIWALRAIAGYAAVKLGIDASQVVK